MLLDRDTWNEFLSNEKGIKLQLCCLRMLVLLMVKCDGVIASEQEILPSFQKIDMELRLILCPYSMK